MVEPICSRVMGFPKPLNYCRATDLGGALSPKASRPIQLLPPIPQAQTEEAAVVPFGRAEAVNAYGVEQSAERIGKREFSSRV